MTDETMLEKVQREHVDGRCEWYLLCTNASTHDEPHPILGNVPTCDRCGEKIQRLKQR
jgi:hypothetical protein